jgi:Tfp pilus assembly protein PilX
MRTAVTTESRSDERGIALIFTLFLMASLSALAVSLMFLAQTETSSTRNYRTMSQARYAGEAGVHKAINFMINSYTVPSSFASYNLTVSPVTCIAPCATVGGGVVLSTFASGSGYPTTNYPDATVATAFATAVTGKLATNVSGNTTDAGFGTVTYGAYAKLLSMRQVVVYGGGTGTVQTWEITAVGTVPGALPATVEVTAMLEQDVAPAETFAVFATGDQCGAIRYTGTGGTDSYNSSSMTLAGTPPVPVTTASGGAVGTNGNLSLAGAVTVSGTLSTPRSGVGACATGSVTAMTGVQASVTGGLIQLPQAKVYLDPVIPASGAVPDDDWDFDSSMSESACNTKMASKGWSCTVSGNDITIAPVVSGTPLPLGNVTVGGNQNLIIGGTGVEKLNWNSIHVAGNTTISMTNTLTELNLAGTGLGSSDPVMDFEGNFHTTTFDPTKFQIMYAGTNEIKLRGSNALAATIYAPNAFVSMASEYDVYGSILAKTFENSGHAMVHYDTSLSSKYFTLGNRVMSSFSWKKY